GASRGARPHRLVQGPRLLTSDLTQHDRAFTEAQADAEGLLRAHLALPTERGFDVEALHLVAKVLQLGARELEGVLDREDALVPRELEQERPQEGGLPRSPAPRNQDR